VQVTQQPISTAGILPEEREQMILNHLPQVRLIARRIHSRLPQSVSLEDLESTGVMGLISAIDNFDATQQVKLKTYAEYKIRGAILDSLRRLDWAPRHQRKQAKQIEAAIASIQQDVKRVPTEDEIATKLGLSLAEYHNWLVTRAVTLRSLDASSSEGEHGNLLKSIWDDEDQWPSTLLERSELQVLIADGIRNLPPMETTVLTLYYYEELTLREISQMVNLHESRISQLKTRAMLGLRSYVQNRWPSRGLAVSAAVSLTQRTQS
jgi:RNA polymerase sigma factor for flagellar operon FliA